MPSIIVELASNPLETRVELYVEAHSPKVKLSILCHGGDVNGATSIWTDSIHMASDERLRQPGQRAAVKGFISPYWIVRRVCRSADTIRTLPDFELEQPPCHPSPIVGPAFILEAVASVIIRDVHDSVCADP